MTNYDLIIVGGGISGMTAALSSLKKGIDNILLIERESTLGGLLNQFIHNGYGKKVSKNLLTGPEYVYHVEKRIKKYNIDIKLDTEVLNVSDEKEVTYVNQREGIQTVQGKAIILSTGCREKFTGSITIPVDKYLGIYTIGSAQRLINIQGILPGKNPVVVANSKWAFEVARRLVIEGGQIQGLIIEKRDDIDLLKKYHEIIDEFDIPIIEEVEIKAVLGEDRVTGIKVRLNDNKEKTIKCDSLILSVGYFPEIEVLENPEIDDNTKSIKVNNYRTNIDGIFACGNLIYGMKTLDINKEIDGTKLGDIIFEYLK